DHGEFGWAVGKLPDFVLGKLAASSQNLLVQPWQISGRVDYRGRIQHMSIGITGRELLRASVAEKGELAGIPGLFPLLLEQEDLTHDHAGGSVMRELLQLGVGLISPAFDSLVGSNLNRHPDGVCIGRGGRKLPAWLSGPDRDFVSGLQELQRRGQAANA